MIPEINMTNKGGGVKANIGPRETKIDTAVRRKLEKVRGVRDSVVQICEPDSSIEVAPCLAAP